MGMGIWVDIIVAAILGFFVIRMWPWVSHQLKHGPKGDSRDWMSFALPIVAVVGFVALLMALV